MKEQTLRVVSIPWKDDDSTQYTVEFETSTGQRFSCFSDGYNFELGENAQISNFYWIGEGNEDFDSIFQANSKCEKKLIPLGNWDYFALGIIVEVDVNEVVVDCGGVLITLPNVTSDNRCTGSWIGFKINRLEVEKIEEDNCR